MEPKDFENSISGSCIKTIDGYWAYLPDPLPPEIQYNPDLVKLLSDADRLLGELSGTGQILPNPYLLITPYSRREALSSSRIEGTQASLSDIFHFEASDQIEPNKQDVKEVRNYIRAMEYGLKRLDELPISIRLIREMHEVLMEGVRGENRTPGEIRTFQNYIGPYGCSKENATFVPPPPEEMKQTLSRWEEYLNSDPKEPLLIQCALMHYQFEAIHPFWDGNGRIGRLLITLFLHNRKYLSQPLLYLSEFFEKNRGEYYSRLLAVSQKGDWRGWIDFFLRGVKIQSEDALINARKILDIYNKYQEIFKTKKLLPAILHRLIEEIFNVPMISISRLSKRWGIPYSTVKYGVKKLVDAGVLSEIKGRKRNKIFVAKELFDLLTTGE